MSSKVWTVARIEYAKAVRTKSFVIGIIVMPILFSGGLLMTAISESMQDVPDRHFAIVDRTGELYEVLERAATGRNADGIHDEEGNQTGSRFFPEEAGESGVTLSDRVRDEELFGYALLGADLITPEGEDRSFSWHTATPTDDAVPDWIERTVKDEVRRRRFATAGIDPAVVARLNDLDSMREMGLESVSESGDVEEAEDEDDFANQAVPAILTLVMFMLVMMAAPGLMNNVLEEKMQKIAEVLLSSVPPFELLLGKLISAVGMAVTLSVIYVGAALVFVHVSDKVPEPIRDALGWDTLAWFALFQLMALIIYGSLFSALGAACSEIQDAQSLVMPVMLLAMLPMFLLGVVVTQPNGTIAQAASFFPPATPMVMFLRVTIPPGVALWELLLGIVLGLGFAAVCVLAGGRIFRIGILSHGQTPSMRKLLQWAMTR